jgi:hypothetical protein
MKKMDTSFGARQIEVLIPPLPLNNSVTQTSYLKFLTLKFFIHKKRLISSPSRITGRYHTICFPYAFPSSAPAVKKKRLPHCYLAFTSSIVSWRPCDQHWGFLTSVAFLSVLLPGSKTPLPVLDRRDRNTPFQPNQVRPGQRL